MRRLRYHAVGFALALELVSSSGCGPVEYISQVSSKAATAVSAAKLAQADRYAPFEYTAAEEYLRKAREEGGYSEYQDAIEFGRKAEDYANRARAIAVARMSEASSRSSGITPASEREEPGRSPGSEPK